MKRNPSLDIIISQYNCDITLSTLIVGLLLLIDCWKPWRCTNCVLLDMRILYIVANILEVLSRQNQHVVINCGSRFDSLQDKEGIHLSCIHMIVYLARNFILVWLMLCSVLQCDLCLSMNLYLVAHVPMFAHIVVDFMEPRLIPSNVHLA